MGNRGVISMLRVQNEIAQLSKDLIIIKEKRLILEEKIKSLNNDGYSDFSDEMIRKQLGMANKDEKVIVMSK